MSRFGRSGWRGDVAYSEYLAEQASEAAKTDTRLDETTCYECDEPLKPGEKGLCLDCADYIADEAKRDAEEDAGMRAPTTDEGDDERRAPRCHPLIDAETGEMHSRLSDNPRDDS